MSAQGYSVRLGAAHRSQEGVSRLQPQPHSARVPGSLLEQADAATRSTLARSLARWLKLLQAQS